MTTKKINDVKELEKQYLEAEKVAKDLYEKFTQAKKEEEEAKKAQLSAEKEARKLEIEAAEKKLDELIRAYIKDYGSYTSLDNDNCSSIWRMFF